LLDIDREQIQTFITLVTYKNFTKSAEMLHVAQSTISARLRNLESDIGKTLFNRTNRGVQLTTAGHTFLPYAKRLYELFEEGKKKVSSNDYFSERLVVGGPSSAWNYIFGDALSTFTSLHRDVALELKTHSSENTIGKVLDGIIDVGVSYT
jgi:DNA-binding transcriptional LysR family regulator